MVDQKEARKAKRFEKVKAWRPFEPSGMADIPILPEDVSNYLMGHFFYLFDLYKLRLVSHSFATKVQLIESALLDNVLIIGQMSVAFNSPSDDLLAFRPNGPPSVHLPITPALQFASAVTRTARFGSYVFFSGDGGIINQLDAAELWPASETLKSAHLSLKPEAVAPDDYGGRKVTSKPSGHYGLPQAERQKLPKVPPHRVISLPRKELVSALSTFHHSPLLVAGTSTSITIWNYTTGEHAYTIGADAARHKKALYAMDVSADDKTILTASFDNTIFLWAVNLADATAPITLRKVIHSSDALRQAEFSPDGKRFVVASNAPAATAVYDTQTGTREFAIPGPTAVVNQTIWSSDGALIYSACCDGKIRITNVESQQTIHEIATGKTPYRVALAANDQILVVTKSDHRIQIWSTPTRTLLRIVSFSTFSEYVLALLTRPPKKALTAVN